MKLVLLADTAEQSSTLDSEGRGVAQDVRAWLWLLNLINNTSVHMQREKEVLFARFQGSGGLAEPLPPWDSPTICPHPQTVISPDLLPFVLLSTGFSLSL